MPACRRCNQEKANRYLDEWLVLLKQRRDARVETVESVADRYPALRTRSLSISSGIHLARGASFICLVCGRSFASKTHGHQHAEAVRHFPDIATGHEAIVALG